MELYNESERKIRVETVFLSAGLLATALKRGVIEKISKSKSVSLR
jgi:hypothetical protein